MDTNTNVVSNGAGEDIKLLKVEDVIEGAVLALEKSAVYVDLGMQGTGIIYGLEYLQARDVIKKLNIGDIVKAKVTEVENKLGYAELSLREAKQAIIWNEAEEVIKSKTTLNLLIKEANKGGLIVDWQGIQGFLPVSQLKGEHYPKVSDGDKDKITAELKKFVGQKFDMMILSANPKEGKLIFTEKSGGEGKSFSPSSYSNSNSSSGTRAVDKYKAGDTIEGTVTGVVEFGVFVKLEDKLEGLVHISEISWSLIENPKAIYKPGEKVKAKIIDIKDGKISLSFKALTSNPWFDANMRYKRGQKVSGVVIKFNKHGALISVEEGVSGLMHISEFGSEENMKKMLSLGKICHCYINVFEPKDEKMTLVLNAAK
jgi:small subunit ribosomal protein S1